MVFDLTHNLPRRALPRIVNCCNGSFGLGGACESSSLMFLGARCWEPKTSGTALLVASRRSEEESVGMELTAKLGKLNLDCPSASRHRYA